ncbi:Peptidase propeptide and YPEB domain-containing protein [Lutimaribacter pacificus]|uniref:Peptidase propeptide and YPEB domain-containing protein n=2 Tax=Lutimaribacter pacificus TaxID=391948 RepID=A0A1H0B8N2_9RHOB|nr:Peptidase propeptide and YPEB domain-containing protein [Lutimaribacter pacificus]SHJ59060.1 Peptidase propeptide and YPEB domain-containing protein [Lutimaribacter pacificus]
MKLLVVALTGAMMAAPVAAWADDRPANAQERAAIEEVLRAAGYTAWDEIEWDDDNYWEVDDARGADNREYELKLDKDLTIISTKPD